MVAYCTNYVTVPNSLTACEKHPDIDGLCSAFVLASKTDVCGDHQVVIFTEEDAPQLQLQRTQFCIDTHGQMFPPSTADFDGGFNSVRLFDTFCLGAPAPTVKCEKIKMADWWLPLSCPVAASTCLLDVTARQAKRSIRKGEWFSISESEEELEGWRSLTFGKVNSVGPHEISDGKKTKSTQSSFGHFDPSSHKS